MFEALQPTVKSITFVTLVALLETDFKDEQGPDALAEFYAALHPMTRATLHVARPGSWIEERFLFDAITVLYERGYGGDDDRFSAFLRQLATHGIGRHLRVFLSLTSPAFALARIPAAWAHLRRNAGSVIAKRQGGSVELFYDGFPFFDAAAYRLLSIANCQALTAAGTGVVPSAVVEDWSRSTLRLRFDVESCRKAA